MDWVKLTVTVPSKHLQAAEPIACMASPNGLYIEDYTQMEQEVMEISHIDLIDESLLSKRRDICLIHMFLSPDQNPQECQLYLSEQLNVCGIPYNIDRQTVNDENWATAWKAYYKPTRAGDRIVVVPTWETYSKKPGELILHMDPGMAFGTGTHETTSLCIKAAEKYVTPGCAVLDLGCGSGILSVSAMLLGAGHFTAVDIDETAARVTRENATLNNIDINSYKVYCANLLEDEPLRNLLCNEGYDIIFANIVADVIIAFAPLFCSMLRDGGTIIASGIIDTRKQDILETISHLGLYVKEENVDKGWVSLVLGQ